MTHTFSQAASNGNSVGSNSQAATSQSATSQSASSQNALKAGIYTNRLLPNEDPLLVKECVDGYVRDFDITTTTGYQLAQELAQTVLKLNRIEAWQSDLIESHLSKQRSRLEFASQLNLSMLGTDRLPDWYFSDCQKSRTKARKIFSALGQLLYLIDNHSADLMMRIRTNLPDLWWFVMGTSDATAKVYTFADKLSAYSNQSDPRLRLQDLKKHLLEKYHYEVAWAQSEERYEKVLSGLRAQVQMDLLANPNLQRGEAALHRKKTDLLAQLIQLKREEHAFKFIALEKSTNNQVEAATTLESKVARVKTKPSKGGKE